MTKNYPKNLQNGYYLGLCLWVIETVEVDLQMVYFSEAYKGILKKIWIFENFGISGGKNMKKCAKITFKTLKQAIFQTFSVCGS